MTTRDDDVRVRPGRINHGNRGAKRPQTFVGEVMRAAKRAGHVGDRSPGADKQANWLPAPDGEFILMMRLYWPKNEAVNGAWVPPPVRPMD